MSSFIDERDRAFYMAYRRAWEEGAGSHREAVERALGSMTDRLWVSERYLRVMIDRRLRGRCPAGGRGGLYDELYARFCRMRGEHGGDRSVSKIIASMVYSPAAGFPISRRTAERIIKRMRKRLMMSKM